MRRASVVRPVPADSVALCVHYRSAAAAAEAMMSYLDRVYRRHHKPLWLTEFNVRRRTRVAFAQS